MIESVQQIAPVIGVFRACDVFSVPRATFYRHRDEEKDSLSAEAMESTNSLTPRPSPRRLDDDERQQILDLLHSERFVDDSPAEVVATLLDEGVYICSERTMYRILEEAGESRERRDQLTHPPYTKPELIATAPNQVWSWDITKLKGPVTWTYFHLYVILDIFSRYVVGWMIADCESKQLAVRLIEETCEKQRIIASKLTIHADRGAAMKSKLLAQLLADLGITKTHSRPHVSNDNPFSESQFKTLKYRPEFPRRFDNFEHARSFCRLFFDWYNHRHHHSGIAMLTPEQLHIGLAQRILEQRQAVLDEAYRAHPERFVAGPPTVPSPPRAVWINPPATTEEAGR